MKWHYTTVGEAPDRPLHPTAYPLGVGQRVPEMEVMDRVTRGLVQGGRAQPIIRIQTPSNASSARGGTTWPWYAQPHHQL